MIPKKLILGILTLVTCNNCSTPATKPLSKSSVSTITTSNASGTVKLRGESWNVAAGIAMRQDNQTHIVLSDKPFNLEEFALDNKLDSFDILRHKGNTITLKVDAASPNNCLEFTNSQGGGTKCESIFQSAMTIKSNTDTQISGGMHWSEKDGSAIQVDFDVPILTTLERTGEPLPADGGEPGNALKVHFSAIANGDFKQLKAEALAKNLTRMQAAKPDEIEEMVAFLKQITPTNIIINGGTLNGNNAIIDYIGENHGEKVRGVAQLSFVNGQWHLDKTNESADNTNQ